MLSDSILRNLYFVSPEDVRVQLGVSLDSKIPLLGLWQQKCWLSVLNRGLSSEYEDISSEGFFSSRRNVQIARYDASGLQLPRTYWKDCYTKAWLFLLEAFAILFISCESKEGGVKFIGHPMTVSKAKSVWVPKEVDLRSGRTNGNAYGQSIWKASTNFASWVLIIPLIHS